jgi:type IV pilus assembly protein PilQ
VKADTRTNSLIVNDLEENIERVSRLIEILDTQTPQVLIEAKVVEARQTFQRVIGINWSMKNGSIPLAQVGNLPVSLRPEFNMQSGQAASINAGLKLGSFDLLGDIEATLSLFEAEGLVRVISSPRIVTLNGVKANIEQTSEVPFKKVDTGSTGVITTTTQFKPIQLKLDVTPQITADGGVVMAVKVTREFPGQDTTGSGDVPINRRQAETTVLVQNGETTVMGGIFQSDVTEGEQGVPFLRKVPILGGLFRSRTYNKDKNELLIFLTPRILNKDKAFRQQAKGSS